MSVSLSNWCARSIRAWIRYRAGGIPAYPVNRRVNCARDSAHRAASSATLHRRPGSCRIARTSASSATSTGPGAGLVASSHSTCSRYSRHRRAPAGLPRRKLVSHRRASAATRSWSRTRHQAPAGTTRAARVRVRKCMPKISSRRRGSWPATGASPGANTTAVPAASATFRSPTARRPTPSSTYHSRKSGSGRARHDQPGSHRQYVGGEVSRSPARFGCVKQSTPCAHPIWRRSACRRDASRHERFIQVAV